MLYALLTTGLGSALYIAYLLWSKGSLANQLTSSELELKITNTTLEGWKQSYTMLSNTLSSKDAQIQSLQIQNEKYLNQLKTSGAPGVFADLLQKRNT